MFEKIHYDDERVRKESVRQKRPRASLSAARGLPGDGKEVLAALDPNMRSNPPSIDELFDDMIKKGLQPHSKCLESLVRFARSLEQGFKFLRASGNAHKGSISSLLASAEEQAAMERVPYGIFTAFIELLCRFPAAKRSEQALLWPGEGRQWRSRSPVAQAFHLLQIRRLMHAPAWNALLSALAKTGNTVTPMNQPERLKLMEINELVHMCKAVAIMMEINLGLDVQGFHSLCIGMERAAVASIKILENGAFDAGRHDDNNATLSQQAEGAGTPLEAGNFLQLLEGSTAKDNTRSAAKIILRGGPPFIRLRFQALVGSWDRTTSLRAARVNTDLRNAGIPTIPHLITVPRPAHLHAYVRALGSLRDYEGLLSLVQWMVEAKDELAEVIEEQRGGMRRMRLTLIAVRVFLEQGASEEIVALVEQLVESVEEWGGWPVDEELELYRNRGAT